MNKPAWLTENARVTNRGDLANSPTNGRVTKVDDAAGFFWVRYDGGDRDAALPFRLATRPAMGGVPRIVAEATPPPATLRDWHGAGDPRVDWLAFERRPLVLCGTVYGHPVEPDGVQVTTTPIVEATGREVVTASGTRYQLGEPAPDYVAWLAARGTPYDPDRPVKLHDWTDAGAP